MTSNERTIGALIARVEILEKQNDEQAKLLREVRDAIVGAKGGWKTLLGVSAATSGATALILKILPYIQIK
ncbi:hypothetical protein [Maritalea porphyrae]|uniref:hypothetical protein n=1 Tax=Maritalea porphyrae TaxID=880732 RepID=UPI0022AF65B6|nr:hypothetical protein [Maritalea porphyrae]MCZ4270873.1 hypothetical protein [Maritalea porphyrae]